MFLGRFYRCWFDRFKLNSRRLSRSYLQKKKFNIGRVSQYIVWRSWVGFRFKFRKGSSTSLKPGSKPFVIQLWNSWYHTPIYSSYSFLTSYSPLFGLKVGNKSCKSTTYKYHHICIRFFSCCWKFLNMKISCVWLFGYDGLTCLLFISSYSKFLIAWFFHEIGILRFINQIQPL